MGLFDSLFKSALKSEKKLADPLGLVFKKKEAPIVAATPVEMPDPDDEAVKAAKRRKAAQMQRRGGRESTILAGDELKLGG